LAIAGCSSVCRTGFRIEYLWIQTGSPSAAPEIPAGIQVEGDDAGHVADDFLIIMGDGVVSLVKLKQSAQGGNE